MRKIIQARRQYYSGSLTIFDLRIYNQYRGSILQLNINILFAGREQNYCEKKQGIFHDVKIKQ